VLVVLAIGLIVAGDSGLLTKWARYAQGELNLDAGSSLIEVLFDKLLLLIAQYSHLNALAVGAIVYAILEGTEGVGLAMRRRWAEYLTVIATGLLIPLEIYEVVNKITVFRAGALLVNLAVVGYLGYSKRLFVRV